jgi:hypothetical protein
MNHRPFLEQGMKTPAPNHRLSTISRVEGSGKQAVKRILPLDAHAKSPLRGQAAQTFSVW